ncbi:MAG: hypothetical protein WAO55_08150, partial [Candidatus Manganitrophaceae bacterium]
IPVAICTDNTTVSNTDQARENAKLSQWLSPERLQQIHRQARRHSFILTPSRTVPKIREEILSGTDLERPVFHT